MANGTKNTLEDVFIDLAMNIFDAAVLVSRASELIDQLSDSEEDKTSQVIDQINSQLQNGNSSMLMMNPNRIPRLIPVEIVQNQMPWMLNPEAPMIQIPGAEDLYFHFPKSGSFERDQQLYLMSDVLVCKIDEEAGEFVTPNASDILTTIAFFEARTEEMKTGCEKTSAFIT